MKFSESYDQISQHVDWLYRWTQKKKKHQLFATEYTTTDTHIHVDIQPEMIIYGLWLLEHHHYDPENKCDQLNDEQEDRRATTPSNTNK